MFGFGWLKKFPGGAANALSLVPWFGYIADFRSDIERIARSMDGGVRVKFNSHLQCAEFFSKGGAFIAYVEVHGGEGRATNAIITSIRPLDGTKRALLEAELPLRIEFRIGG